MCISRVCKRCSAIRYSHISGCHTASRSFSALPSSACLFFPVAHLSGAGECIDKICRDMDEDLVFAEDGTSADALAFALAGTKIFGSLSSIRTCTRKNNSLFRTRILRSGLDVRSQKWAFTVTPFFSLRKLLMHNQIVDSPGVTI
jgi:hypothetical protein